MTALRRLLKLAAITVVASVIAAICSLLYIENSLIFFPIKGNVGKSPGMDVFVTTADGVKIHGWYVTHPQARITILWTHGNAGNLEDRRDWLEGLRRLPANVLVFDYRGFGLSDGRPNEAGVYLDSLAAYGWLLSEKHVPPEEIVILGESLGGAVAAELATQVKCRALILQSTFTKAGDMADLIVPELPMRWFIRTRFDTIGKVARLDVPKLFIHARDDEVIPFRMGPRLYDAAKQPKQFHWFERGGHNAIFVTLPDEYFPLLRKFLLES